MKNTINNDKSETSTKTKANKPAAPKAPRHNPFGAKPPERTAMDVLKGSFGIGISDVDRGADEWDQNRVNEAGKSEPGWVYVPQVTRECVVEFAVNEGKGTGRQIIPAVEFLDYVASLRGIIDSGYEEPVVNDRTVYIPTDVVARQSFKLVRPKISEIGTDGKATSREDTEADRDIVSVRSASGKGAKPMLIPQGQFEEVVEALEGIAVDLESYETQAWANFKGSAPADAPASDPGEDDASETTSDEVSDDTDPVTDSVEDGGDDEQDDFNLIDEDDQDQE